MSDPALSENSLGLTPSETVGAIMAIVCGGTIIVLLILIVIMSCRYWFYKTSRKSKNLNPESKGRSNARSQQANHERISRIPSGYEAEQATTTSFNVDSSPEPDANQLVVPNTSSPADSDRSPLPLPPPTDEEIEMTRQRNVVESLQFPRDDLLLLDKLGEGEYGPIYRGEAYSLGIRNQSRPVTVKMLAQQAVEECKIMLYQDIEMLTEINHLNVVGVLAVCTKDSPECILLDAGMPGDLLTFVRDKKRDTSPLVLAEKETLELLKIADEVSLGMAYLASERFIHKDLAARNCIIGYDAVVKIAHFGLGPLIYPEAYYRVNDSDLPIRWMPPETITTANFTTSSDIWAYGVLLWELFTYGELPFADKSNEEVIAYVVKELGKLSKPSKCPKSVFSLIQRCWEAEPQIRPTFDVIHEQINMITGQESRSLSPSSPTSPMGQPELGMDLTGYPEYEAETNFQ